MPSITTIGNRAYPSIPEITEDTATHTVALQAIKSALATHERRDRDTEDSFIRFGELVDLGIINAEGDLILETGGIGSLTVEDEGTPLVTLADTLNFVGAGVTATGAAGVKTITIPGGGGGGVTSFEGRTGAVVAVQDDYEDFFLVKPNFADQIVVGDVEFSGTIEFTNIFGVKFGASTELELRNSADTSTTFIQNIGPNLQFGIAGADFGSGVFQIIQTSFAKLECPAIFIKEQSVAEVDVNSYGQLWIRDDSPNTLMFTDDNGNDFTVDVTSA